MVTFRQMVYLIENDEGRIARHPSGMRLRRSVRQGLIADDQPNRLWMLKDTVSRPPIKVNSYAGIGFDCLIHKIRVRHEDHKPVDQPAIEQASKHRGGEQRLPSTRCSV
jgi:hypothetical protein